MRILADNQDDLAIVFGVTRRTIGDWIKQGCPIGPKNYDIGNVIAWMKSEIERGRRFKGWEVGKGNETEPDVDELISRQKLRKLEIETAAREQQLLPRDLVRACMVRMIANLRRAQTMLSRQFGKVAVEIIGESLDDCEREIVGSLERIAAELDS